MIDKILSKIWEIIAVVFGIGFAVLIASLAVIAAKCAFWGACK